MSTRRRGGRRNYKRDKTWTQQFKDYLRQFIAFLFSNVGIICLVVGYTVSGAFLFRFIETSPIVTNNTTDTIAEVHNSTIEALWHKISQYLNPLNETEFKNAVEDQLLCLQDFIVDAVQQSDYDGEQTIADRWTISASSLYCLTVITTIGYGNVAPRTAWGKVATVVYAIFGMPLFLLYLSNIGDLLAKSFKWLYAKICLCKMCRLKRRYQDTSSGTFDAAGVNSNSWRNTPEQSWQARMDRRGEVTEGEESDDEETESSEMSSSAMSSEDPQDITVPISLCLAIMIGYISSGAILFAGWENLNFRDGSYFCFISLSTIGFGDIVPTTTKSDGNNTISSIIEMNFIFCSIYLMLGMALIAMCFNLMQQDVVHKIRTCTDIVKRIARCRR